MAKAPIGPERVKTAAFCAMLGAVGERRIGPSDVRPSTDQKKGYSSFTHEIENANP
jgi:hypothetical protein